MKTINVTKPAVTEMARRLSDYLAETRNITLKHSQAMDAVSRMLGWRSRQAMSSDLKEANRRPASEQRTTVHSLAIFHRHGHDITVHGSEEDLRNTLAAYVRDWWDELVENARSCNLMAEAGLVLAGKDVDNPRFEDFNRDEAIRIYFEASSIVSIMDDEWWEAERHEIALGQTTMKTESRTMPGPAGRAST